MLNIYEEIASIEAEFDSEFYLASYPDVAADGITPIDHFCTFGWREGRNPSATFCTIDYLERYKDVAVSDLNPLYHFVIIGRAEGRKAYPSTVETTDEFDDEFYLTRYPDVAAAKISPRLHYMKSGWKEHRDPSPTFSTKFYLDANADVIAEGVNPLLHYITIGKMEGRLAKPIHEGQPTPNTLDLPQLSPLAAEFDSDYYFATYPELVDIGVDALNHYSTLGWKEGRDPSADFSTNYYLESNPDVAASGVNPFEHFLLVGRMEGRYGKKVIFYKLETLRSAQTLSETSKTWTRAFAPIETLTKNSLELILSYALQKEKSKLVISISHDNYLENPGGVQLCIQREQECFVKEGYLYLNLHPWQPLPCLADPQVNPDPLLKLMMNGHYIGIAATSTITAAVLELGKHLEVCRVIIHHLLGHSTEQIRDLCISANQGKCHFWLHDFFSVCPSYVLQRNGITYCGAPPIQSNACNVCIFGSDRIDHIRRISEMFSALNVDVLSPSEVARQLWLDRAKLRHCSITVVPHMELTFLPRKSHLQVTKDPEIKIGFIGTRSFAKGWKTFENLIRRYRGNANFRFLYFGTSAPGIRSLCHVPVHVTSATPCAMIEALRREEVDFVLHWANWPETFSFSTYESLAAGAFVITNPMSGNVAHVISTTGRGEVLADDEALDQFLAGPAVKKLSDRVRVLRSTETVKMSLSTMTYQPLTEEAF